LSNDARELDDFNADVEVPSLRAGSGGEGLYLSGMLLPGSIS
jgi:hypothetical protein